jgi:hypothetical protein
MSQTFLIAFVSRGNPGENRATFGGLGTIPILLQDRADVAQAYFVHGTPAAIAVDQHGSILSAVMMGGEQIRSLVASASRVVLRDERQAPLERLPAILGRD